MGRLDSGKQLEPKLALFKLHHIASEKKIDVVCMFTFAQLIDNTNLQFPCSTEFFLWTCIGQSSKLNSDVNEFQWNTSTQLHFPEVLEYFHINMKTLLEFVVITLRDMNSRSINHPNNHIQS